jgi:hypothetical protein
MKRNGVFIHLLDQLAGRFWGAYFQNVACRSWDLASGPVHKKIDRKCTINKEMITQKDTRFKCQIITFKKVQNYMVKNFM